MRRRCCSVTLSSNLSSSDSLDLITHGFKADNPTSGSNGVVTYADDITTLGILERASLFEFLMFRKYILSIADTQAVTKTSSSFFRLFLFMEKKK